MSVKRAVGVLGAAIVLLTSCGGGGKSGSPSAAVPPPTPVRWIAAGDSYSSGAGALSTQGVCRTSDKAMAPVARDLVRSALVIEDFAHVACADNIIDQVLGQVLNAQSGKNEFNLVTLTIGGNDIGFAQVVADCLGQDDLRDIVTRGTQKGCDVTEAELLARVATLSPRLVELYKKIVDELAPRAGLVVIGYPNLLSDPDGWKDDTCLGVSKADAGMLRRVAAALDLAIASAATVVNASYVSVIDEFKTHEVCGAGEPWINGLTLRSGATFHPTEAGYRAEAELLANALRKLYRVG